MSLPVSWLRWRSPHGDGTHPLAIVDVGEGVCLLRDEPPEGEESLVDRARAQPTAQRHQARLVVGTDRAEANRGTIAQCDDLLKRAGVSSDPNSLGWPGAPPDLN